MLDYWVVILAPDLRTQPKKDVKSRRTAGARVRNDDRLLLSQQHCDYFHWHGG